MRCAADRSQATRPSCIGRSDLPAERRCVYRGVPEPGHLIVEPEEGDREAGHLETRDVVADEAPADRDALAAENLVHAVERAVELDERRATHAVHEGEDGVAALQA